MRLLAGCLSILMSSGCIGPLGPSCDRKTGPVLADTPGTVAAGATIPFEVTSPVNSNLFITVIWNNANADLGLQATIVACGGHAGCQLGVPVTALRTRTMIRELQVDGWRGKQYRVEVLGDGQMDQDFMIRVTYDTGICT